MLESRAQNLRADNTDVYRWRGMCDQIFSFIATEYKCTVSDKAGVLTYWVGSSSSFPGIMSLACGLCKTHILDKWDITLAQKKVFYNAFVALVSYTFNMFGENGDRLAPKYFGIPFPTSAMNRVSSFDDLVVFFNRFSDV